MRQIPKAESTIFLNTAFFSWESGSKARTSFRQRKRPNGLKQRSAKYLIRTAEIACSRLSRNSLTLSRAGANAIGTCASLISMKSRTSLSQTRSQAYLQVVGVRLVGKKKRKHMKLLGIPSLTAMVAFKKQAAGAAATRAQ